MAWLVTYYSERVRKDVLAMPAGIVADYVRLTDAMTVHGADHRRSGRDRHFAAIPKVRHGMSRRGIQRHQPIAIPKKQTRRCLRISFPENQSPPRRSWARGLNRAGLDTFLCKSAA